MRRSAFVVNCDGEPSIGEGVSGEGVSNLDGGLLNVIEAEAVR
jgi:hypothetical protein